MNKMGAKDDFELDFTEREIITEEMIQKHKEIRKQMLQRIQDFIIKNIDILHFVYISEDGETEVTLIEFEQALENARVEELVSFVKAETNKKLFFEDGYIIVKLKGEK